MIWLIATSTLVLALCALYVSIDAYRTASQAKRLSNRINNLPLTGRRHVRQR